MNLGTFEGDEFDDGGVQGRSLKLRRRAAFHIGHFRAFVGDDEGTFELTEVFGVDAEVGLQGLFHLNAFRDVDEGAAGEDCGVERGEFVVARWDDFAEPATENLGVIA